MRQFEVVTKDSGNVTVKAALVGIEERELRFRTEEGSIVAIFAPGEWTYFLDVESQR